MRPIRATKSICLALLASGLAASSVGAKVPTVVPVAPAPVPVPGVAAAAQAGGRQYGEDDPLSTPTVPGLVARVLGGVAYAPAGAPEAVKQVIWAGNEIVGAPYRYGGGHGAFEDTAYDCSGTVSFALHGADLVKRPRDSSGFFRFGAAGPGAWVSIFTRSSHAYVTVAGIRLDTSPADDPAGGKGPRWRPLRPSDAGFTVRHPVGL